MGAQLTGKKLYNRAAVRSRFYPGTPVESMKSVFFASKLRFALIVLAALVCLHISAIPLWAAGGTGSANPNLSPTGHLIMMIVYTVVALGFSFLCSVAEAVVLSISPSYIQKLTNDGNKAASRVAKLKGNIDRSLAAILTLNTIAHTVGAGGAGAEAAAYFGDKYVGLSMAVLTLLILFLSEIVPKTVGAVYWRSLAPITAWFVNSLIWILFPLIFLSELLTKLITGGKALHGISREEFAALADVGAAAGEIDVNESKILKNMFRFPSLRVEDVMTPRTVVFALQEDLTVHELMEQHHELAFSRIPVYGKNRDDVTGFVLKTDILLNEARQAGKARLRDIRRDLRAIRDETPLSDALDELLDNRAHILLAVDAYGGMQGLITLEDVVETLIGFEIVDEADKNVDMRDFARQEWKKRMERIGVKFTDGSTEIVDTDPPRIEDKREDD